jgi:predicted DNA-binding transcriptional regulator AlpA
MSTTTHKRAISEKAASDYIGMSNSFLRQSRMDGDRQGRTPGPRYLKIGRSVRYLIEDLDCWLEQFRTDAGR